MKANLSVSYVKVKMGLLAIVNKHFSNFILIVEYHKYYLRETLGISISYIYSFSTNLSKSG